MQYTDEQAAGQIFGINHSITPRPSKPGDGQETSANGTGPEETCARQGGAISGPPAAAMPSNVPIAPARGASQYQDQILDLVRALARDAAQVDYKVDLLRKIRPSHPRISPTYMEKKNDNITCSRVNIRPLLFGPSERRLD